MVTNFSFKTAPMAHQAEFIKRFGDSPTAALFCEMGTGKTKMAIDYIRKVFFDRGKLEPILVVCPLIALHNWKDEFYKHSNIGPYVQVLDGYSKAKNLKLLDAPGKALFIINYGKIASMFDDLVVKEWTGIVLDESHRIKNGKASRTKDLIRLAPYSKFRLILTGTPVLNCEIDLFWQMYFLDFGATLGNNFYGFRNKWFRDLNQHRKHLDKGQYFPKFKLYDVFRDEFHNKVRDVAFIKTTEECLDLPPKVYRTIKLEMDPEQKKVYEKLKEEYVVGLLDGSVVASTAGVLQMRLNQLSSGFAKLDTGEEVRFKTNPKVQAIKELMEDLPEDAKIIVWACFRNNIFLLQEELKAWNPTSIFGDTADKREEEARFKSDPSCRIMIANPQSASVAINLVEACGAIYYSQGFSHEHRVQSEARCHRIGSERHASVWYVDLAYRNTIDGIVAMALREKKNITELLMNPDSFREDKDG